jgi:hypothetical protein
MPDRKKKKATVSKKRKPVTKRRRVVVHRIPAPSFKGIVTAKRRSPPEAQQPLELCVLLHRISGGRLTIDGRRLPKQKLATVREQFTVFWAHMLEPWSVLTQAEENMLDSAINKLVSKGGT